LQRILGCILQAEGKPVDTSKLLEAGWPGERIQAPAGQSRVYVAISTLRRLGLREAIEHDERGYWLSPSVDVDG
jgi:DNA-binding winged helix-turn-helix (wHTH) protein